MKTVFHTLLITILCLLSSWSNWKEEHNFIFTNITRQLIHISQPKNCTPTGTNSPNYNYEILKKENKALRTVHRQLLFILIICISFLLTGRVIFIIYRKSVKSKIRQQEKELEKWNDEHIKMYARLTNAKHKLEEAKELQQDIISLSNRYKQLQKEYLKTSGIYKKLVSLCSKKRPNNNQPILTDKQWKLLIKEICNIYPEFQSSLFTRCPYLSEEEWRYCCLHILGFDGNDEAILLGIIPSSVWMKRSRIKQKLNLSAQKDKSLYNILNDSFLH